MAKLVRFATLPYEETLEKLKLGSKCRIQGKSVNALSSKRVRCFIRGEGRCVKCGIQGSIWAIERHDTGKSYHINLYGLNEKGKEVMLTRDHIIPKSKGGTEDPLNSQVLCFTCNCEKGNIIEEN